MVGWIYGTLWKGAMMAERSLEWERPREWPNSCTIVCTWLRWTARPTWYMSVPLWDLRVQFSASSMCTSPPYTGK